MPRIFLAVLALSAAILLFSLVMPRTQGQQTPLETKTIQLPAGQKLEGVSWACSPSGYCVPTYLTRPMRADEIAETHTLRNEQGYYNTYIFSEHRAPTEQDIH